ncbi:hypothetical protein M408DRAFT_173726 [Serendipita vermifera MAFF 305830]|uniref:Uncharacterized protein n=1 Tax=Serendipita vermifera MAFF 305830 TaxID=933852 RepID=A0A0C3ARF3_SERVB|nr:hypothetical protein M408DRAFT_173726 [Serendipita vermifera MAFF 305830]
MTRINLSDSPSSETLDHSTDHEISDVFANLWTCADEDPHLHMLLEELLVQREATAKAVVQSAQRHLKFIDEETAQMRRLLREKAINAHNGPALGLEIPAGDPSASDCFFTPRTSFSIPVASIASESSHTSETLRPGSIKPAGQQVRSATNYVHEYFHRENEINESKRLLRERYKDEIERMWEDAAQERSHLDAERQTQIPYWRRNVSSAMDLDRQPDTHTGYEYALPLNEDDLWEAAVCVAIEQRREEAEEQAIIEQWEQERREEIRIQEETSFTENMKLAAELAAAERGFYFDDEEDYYSDYRLRVYESSRERKAKARRKEMLKQSGNENVQQQGKLDCPDKSFCLPRMPYGLI